MIRGRQLPSRAQTEIDFLNPPLGGRSAVWEPQADPFHTSYMAFVARSIREQSSQRLVPADPIKIQPQDAYRPCYSAYPSHRELKKRIDTSPPMW